MSSFKTGSSNKKLQPGTVIVGENGLPVDTIATISGSYQIVYNTTTPLSYTAGVVTVNSVISLLPVRGHKSRYTGKLILQTVDKGMYFIDKVSVDDSTKSFLIYSDEDQTSVPPSIDLSAGWIIAEAEIVNRLATTSSAKIDSVEFRDMQFQFELDGDPVTVRGENGNTLEPNPDGSINIGGVVNVDTDLTNVEDKLDVLIGEAQDANLSLDGIAGSAASIDSKLTQVNSNLDSLELKLDDSNASLDAIESSTSSLDAKLTTVNNNLANIEADTSMLVGQSAVSNSELAEANTHLQAIEDALSQPLEIAQPVVTAGTEDGNATSPKFVTVYSRRQQVLDSKDRVATFTYEDFGTKDQRIASIVYTSPTFPGVSIRREFSYSQVLGRYRRDSETWSEDI